MKFVVEVNLSRLGMGISSQGLKKEKVPSV